ncbi:N-acetylglucosamine kinase [[Eubacterium] cellulosolvens]
MALLVGVDGGATKTVAVVGRQDGSLLGSARAPSSNYHNVGVKKAARSIRASVSVACRRASAPTKSLETVVMGLAAMDSPRDFLVGRKVANLTRLGKRRIVKHDSVIALYAATLGRPGIVVNAGTGSFAAGIDADGRVIRAGGWGNIIDDEGSAYDVGKLAIRASLRALDGREKKTAIAEILQGKLDLRTLEDIVPQVHEKPMSVEQVAAISKLAAQAALKGDRVARDIFAHEGQVLASLVSAIARRLNMTRDKPDIYCTGGVFRAGAAVLNPFRRELRKTVRRFVIRRPSFEPVVGAFILALKEEGRVISGRTLENLQASYAQHTTNVQ